MAVTMAAKLKVPHKRDYHPQPSHTSLQFQYDRQNAVQCPCFKAADSAPLQCCAVAMQVATHDTRMGMHASNVLLQVKYLSASDTVDAFQATPLYR
jgi:hypothetical protein